jgi:endonuclease YncB( thermonuclease family)
MRPAALVTALAGIAIVFGLISAGGQRLGGAMNATQPAAMPEAGTAETATAAPSTADPEASMNARPVDDASQFYPATVEGKPLERVAAQEPEKPKAEDEKGIDFPRPVAESAGLLAFGDRRLQLAGVTPTPADKTCTGSDATEWPCGMLAKTNFRLFPLPARSAHRMCRDGWSKTVGLTQRPGRPLRMRAQRRSRTRRGCTAATHARMRRARSRTIRGRMTLPIPCNALGQFLNSVLT